MPKTSDRQQLLSELLGVISACALDEDEDNSSSLDEFDAENAFDTDMDDLMDLYTLVSSHRYISDRAMVPKRRKFSMEDLFLLPDDNFRQLTRMSKPTFVFVLGEIEQHPIFHSASTTALSLADPPG
ncbi:hypothetical protein P3T76_001870 [Phytophthora citrophthora]|uniref:Uncharacterized protein n=1 Tax=Phytophthora citrophthora TaxID=4793 RepID=A0AAD9GX41_9STRA|nr:hypothetical protein P3T76_001870 [Phytophthora citrophthora]